VERGLLRLEKGHLILGQDTTPDTPFDVNLTWGRGDGQPFFVGQRSLKAIAAAAPAAAGAFMLRPAFRGRRRGVSPGDRVGRLPARDQHLLQPAPCAHIGWRSFGDMADKGRRCKSGSAWQDGRRRNLRVAFNDPTINARGSSHECLSAPERATDVRRQDALRPVDTVDSMKTVDRYGADDLEVPGGRRGRPE